MSRNRTRLVAGAIVIPVVFWIIGFAFTPPINVDKHKPIADQLWSRIERHAQAEGSYPRSEQELLKLQIFTPRERRKFLGRSFGHRKFRYHNSEKYGPGLSLNLMPGTLGAIIRWRNQELAAAYSTLFKAADYFRFYVAVHGGYVYYYSLDLKERCGEGLAQPEEIWVQPPGTPTVGMAYLKAYQATGDTFYLDAAREAAEVLVYGRLRSGGWQNSIDLQGIDSGKRFSGGDQRKPGFSSLDDGQSQSAIQFLALTDEALKFKDKPIHQASLNALDALLTAQFPNGGFPQGWDQPASEQPVISARFPDYDWKTEGRIKNYWDMYTLNDNVCGYVAEALSVAYDVYNDPKYLTALKKLGDFLILAQLPEPQPAWAQQYNYEMVPIWARKFEPPAIAGDESQEVIETLLRIHTKTGDAKYLEPIPRALDYLERSLLPDGRLARYYELQTNRPLYMTRPNRDTYELTYDDSDLPSHYGWKSAARIGEFRSDYERLKNGGPATSGALSSSEAEVRHIVDALDDQGRWISVHDDEQLVGQPEFEQNTPYISSAVFSRNVEILAEFVAASRQNED